MLGLPYDIFNDKGSEFKRCKTVHLKSKTKYPVPIHSGSEEEIQLQIQRIEWI